MEGRRISTMNHCPQIKTPSCDGDLYCSLCGVTCECWGTRRGDTHGPAPTVGMPNLPLQPRGRDTAVLLPLQARAVSRQQSCAVASHTLPAPALCTADGAAGEHWLSGFPHELLPLPPAGHRPSCALGLRRECLLQAQRSQAFLGLPVGTETSSKGCTLSRCPA